MAHAIIDGVIDIPRTKGYVFEKEDAKISADAVSFLGLFDLCPLERRIEKRGHKNE